MALRSWTVEMPPGVELLNANRRIHWRTRARVTKQLRTAAALVARSAKVPGLTRVHIVGEYQPPDRRRRDVANLYPSFKALVDGIVDAGVLPDDNDKHVVGPDMRLGVPHPGGRLVLHITELLPLEGAGRG